MEIKCLHRGWWLSGMLMLLCWACGGSGADTEEPEVSKGPFLEIHVYSPELPHVSRADIGETAALEEESRVNNLSIWVFENLTGKFVGFLSPTSIKTNDNTYRITVSETFARTKPAVDIYVVANVAESNTGLRLDKNTTRAELEAALIKHDTNADWFGLTAPQSEVPTAGLPMSGVLKGAVVDGIAPIVYVQTNVKVARAVSKVRFVFCNSSTADDQKLRITNITIDSGMIPTEEYLFLDEPYNGRNYNIGSGFEPATALVNTDVEVKSYSTPTDYVHVNQTGAEYERLINTGIVDEKLTEVGRFYLRETNQKIMGTLKYKIGDSDTKLPAQFMMADAGDFSRNHTWIVYGYFAGKDNFKVFSVEVGSWGNATDSEYEVYNW